MEEYKQDCFAPFVKDAPVQIACHYVNDYLIKENDTLLVIGAIKHLFVQEEMLLEDGWVQLDKGESSNHKRFRWLCFTTTSRAFSLCPTKRIAMEFISNSLYDYVVEHSQEEPALLADLSRQTHLKVLQPRMLSGPLQGRFLSVLAKLLQPKKILEVGTFTGYATLCLAEGLDSDGQIDTLDKNEELVDFQRSFFDRSPWGKQIHQYCGDAIEIIPTLEGEYDLVFLDADKNYLIYLELLLPKIKKGGLLLSDNVLWSGKVLEETQKNDRETAVLKEFNQKLAQHSQLETVLLPLRDGLTLSRKI